MKLPGGCTINPSDELLANMGHLEMTAELLKGFWFDFCFTAL